MAYMSVNIPSSLGYEVKSHEIQPEKSFGEELKKMKESSTSSPRHTERYEVKSLEIQREKSVGDKLKKMEEGSTSSPQSMERYEVKSHEIQSEKSLVDELKKIQEFRGEIKQWHDKFTEIGRLLEVPSQCKIYRVHRHLRNINYKAYEPEVIAIGPYHRDKVNLKMMEEHKQRYFIALISGNKLKSDEYYSAIRPLEQVARNCYADPISLNEAEFIKMLILDGCFIIELARKFEMKEYDSITGMHWMIKSVRRDLILFENQIPFFILCKLFDLIEGTDQHGRLIKFLTSLLYKIYLVKNDDLLSYASHFEGNVRPDKIKHLLHLMHLKLVSSFDPEFGRNQFFKSATSPAEADVKFIRHECVEFERKQFIKSATWLAKANVKFKRNEAAHSLFDIKFEDGTLLLPPLRIGDTTESLLRNFIAYEQYFEDTYRCVTDYVVFFDSLIDSSSDIEMLSRCGIINHTFSDDEAAAQAINELTISVVISENKFNFRGIFDKLEGHCSKRWNRWMANLRKNYLNSPWAIIYVLAAIVLLLLTFLQTLFSGLAL